MSKTNRLIVFLWLLTLASALALITVRHQNRLAFMAWGKVEAEKSELQTDYGRLLLERATWSDNRHVMTYARERLAMVVPAPEKIITLKLKSSK